MCGDEIPALNKNVTLGKCACHCEFNDFPISKNYLWVILVVALRNIAFWCCSMTCQSLDFITQYLIIHDVTESYAGNRLKFKVDQCIFMLETGEFIDDSTSHITVWHSEKWRWWDPVQRGLMGALLVHPAVCAGFPSGSCGLSLPPGCSCCFASPVSFTCQDQKL